MNPFLKQLGIWTLICSISAAPSFSLALIQFDHPQQVLAMLFGVSCFILVYSAVGCTTRVRRWRRSPRFRRTIQVGYGTRIAMSALSLCLFVGLPFPIVVDLWCGAMSLGAVKGLGLDQERPLSIWLTTMLQGGLLNLILLLYMLIVYAILMPFVPSAPKDGTCGNCGYDLRASRDICPECGTAIAVSQASSSPR